MSNIPCRNMYLAAGVTSIVLACGLIAALIAETFFGFAPCELCLAQRWPYYLGAPLAVLVACCAHYNAPQIVTRMAMLALCALCAWSFVLAFHHSGIEFGWWPAPDTCRGTVLPSRDAGALLNRLLPVVPCDAPPHRFLGLLSFANLNMLLSGVLVVVNSAALWTSLRPKKIDHLVA